MAILGALSFMQFCHSGGASSVPWVARCVHVIGVGGVGILCLASPLRLATVSPSLSLKSYGAWFAASFSHSPPLLPPAHSANAMGRLHEDDIKDHGFTTTIAQYR